MDTGADAFARYRKLLQELISFQTISTDESYYGEMENCAQWLNELFNAYGFKTSVFSSYGNPILIAHYDAGCAETCLIYGHYDVQPAAKEEGWQKDPFTVDERDGRFFARGAVDNKGQVLIHIAAITKLIEEGNLGYNIVLLIEGDEETGSPGLQQFVRDHKDELLCDFVLISDGEGIGEQPTFEASCRGAFDAEVKIKTADTDMHSGLYGGIACNAAELAAAFVASKLPSALWSKDILRYGLKQPPEEILKTAPPFDLASFEEMTGGALKDTKDKRNTQLDRCPEMEVPKRLGFWPSLEVTGINAGYTSEGFRNAIPAEAVIKLNVRLAPSQSAEECVRRFSGWVHYVLPDMLPPNASFSLNIPFAVDGVLLAGKENPYLDRARPIVEMETGDTVAMRPCGATLPVVVYLDHILGKPQVLLSLGNEDCNMHAVNENITVKCVEQGIAISRAFFSRRV